MRQIPIFPSGDTEVERWGTGPRGCSGGELGFDSHSDLPASRSCWLNQEDSKAYRQSRLGGELGNPVGVSTGPEGIQMETSNLERHLGRLLGGGDAWMDQDGLIGGEGPGKKGLAALWGWSKAWSEAQRGSRQQGNRVC